MNGAEGYMIYRQWASPWRQIVEYELRLRDSSNAKKREQKSAASDRLAEMVSESKLWSQRNRRAKFYDERKRLHQEGKTVGTPLTENQVMAVAIRSLEGRKK